MKSQSRFRTRFFALLGLCLHFVLVVFASDDEENIPLDDFEIRDKNRDGRVTRQEFVDGSRGGSDSAFACLDGDMNGYVTKEEQNALKKRFYRSRLSQLNSEEVLDWLMYPKCVPTDMSKYANKFKQAGLNGLSLWEYGVRSPRLLKNELKIGNPVVRRTLVQAICREIEGLGCLGPPVSADLMAPTTRENKTEEKLEDAIKHVDSRSFFEGGQDQNDDGQVSEEEFVRQQARGGVGVLEAFHCLDPDRNGQITRQEMWELKTRFWRSKLSKLSNEELIKWLSDDKCVPTNMEDYIPAFKKHDVRGLTLWSIGIQNPRLLHTILGIKSDMKRAHLTEAICREILDSGCFSDTNKWTGLFGGWKYWGSTLLSFDLWQVLNLILSFFGFLAPLAFGAFRLGILNDTIRTLQEGTLNARLQVGKMVKKIRVPNLVQSQSNENASGTASKKANGPTKSKSHTSLQNLRSDSSKVRKANMEAKRAEIMQALSALAGVQGEQANKCATFPPSIKESLLKSHSDSALADDFEDCFEDSDEGPYHTNSTGGAAARGCVQQSGNGMKRSKDQPSRTDSARSQSSTRPTNETGRQAQAQIPKQHADGTAGAPITLDHATAKKIVRQSMQETEREIQPTSIEEFSASAHGSNIRKRCNYCNKLFSKNWFIRKMERYQCKKCGLFFCAAHKSKGHHGCRSLGGGRAMAGRHEDLSMSTHDGDYEPSPDSSLREERDDTDCTSSYSN
uniref:EF-hand domain-containing protein n=1 Tax=Guillardia theta TaxID=55529 RepID=A0A7S4UGX8_GUITH|mmetsp:Transcript_49127/g.154223  ORF Transcript_49127/g.154223 Transcript_49127/m.154223 type:complete len:734 (+) Transcript_49127:224-2425(+)